MPTPNLKADVRPIAFVLHNQATGATPVKVDLAIRPEDLQRTDVSRVSVAQTLGGAWADAWGDGIATVTISGTTGWGQGKLRNGLDAFLELHDTVYQQWHRQRGLALAQGLDPDDVKLLFIDDLDEFVWVVVPNQFVLRRNKARPLLAQYQIMLTRVDDGGFDRALAESDMRILAPVDEATINEALESMAESIGYVEEDLSAVIDEIGEAAGASGVGGFAEAVADLVDGTNAVLEAVKDGVSSVDGLMSDVLSPIEAIGAELARAAANVAQSVQQVLSLPDRAAQRLIRVAQAYLNAYCILRNIFRRRRRRIPSFDELLGSSMCASTTGAARRSPTAGMGVSWLEGLRFGSQSEGGLDATAGEALSRLLAMDPVLAPPPLESLMTDVSLLGGGLKEVVREVA